MILNDRFSDRNVCVLGLGYVGLTLAAVMADVGFRVTGVEIRKDVLDGLKKGRAHFFEPGLNDLLHRLVATKQIRFERFLPKNVKASLYIITVGTPLNVEGKVRLDMVENMSREVASRLRKGDMVIVRSTMKLGTVRKIVAPILRTAGVPFDLAFCPERTLEGQALQELRQLPQIVGGFDAKSAIRASQIFQFLTPTVVRVDDLETAEMIKLIDNAQRDVSFAYANEVARMCDAVGVSALDVIRAGKLGYPRTNLPLPGPVGGPCLEKDSYILAEGLRELGLEPEITLAARRLNEAQPEEIIDHVAQILRRTKGFPDKPVISILGLAFKGRPATDDLRGTMCRPIFSALKKEFPGATFRGYDAVVKPDAIRAFGLLPATSIERALKGAHLAVIANNHPIFSSMDIPRLAGLMKRPSLIYDFWNSVSVSGLQLPAGTGYMALGSHARSILPRSR